MLQTMTSYYFRFANLEKIHTRDCLNLLDNLNGKALLKNCRKLSTFQVDTTQRWCVEFCQLLYKSKDILTVINTTCIQMSPGGFEFVGLLEFITSFPRLKHICGCTAHFLKYSKDTCKSQPD